MKRLKRSLSLRSSRRHIPESHRPQVWENDSYKVRNGGVSFPVKYVGSIEVTESRGTQVCAEAFRKMREAGVHKKKRMNLLVTSDCIRVVDEETKSLAIDQTIEKVSFCTPDPTDDRAFSYICREGTTRRWMCHCFIAVRDTGERLSHAVGCAFTACLQRKQKSQALQQQAKPKEGANTSQDGQPTTTVTTSATPAAQPQTPLQQQQSSQLTTTTTASSTAASPVMNGPTATLGVVSSPQPAQPMLATTQQQAIAQPVLKPPPPVARARPQPFAPSPFTRHMSLRYRSTPMSHLPLRDTNTKAGYATLEEEPGMAAPKMPSSVDALGLQTTTPVAMQPNLMHHVQPAPVMVTSTQGASMFNGMHPSTVVTGPAVQLQYNATPVPQATPQFVAQQPVAKQWSATPQQQQSHQQLERKLSEAEMWLASAEGSGTSSNNQGLLATHNPFSDATTQVNALTGAWTQDLSKALPNANQTNNPWGGTGLQQVREEDEFASLASRHTGSPTGSPANPFNKGSEVYWV